MTKSVQVSTLQSQWNTFDSWLMMRIVGSMRKLCEIWRSMSRL